ncbi:hypothetical protein [Williamwhitmania taraxaci]|uniref:Uncharacterized protein n=1 Tax=Williamwhitmania taraxaci TaxID=1640674 RepID=A0A1G6QY49_9BACT|nr:hypothetical protein [Williamwhitmania taraxaci]SDC97218.1 hypothetical protein SAMN05216323_10679 [Williamwhitmania taraxaci]
MPRLRIVGFVIACSFAPLLAFSQGEFRSLRTKTMLLCQQTVSLDSLSIVPGSVIITDTAGVAVPPASFNLNWQEGSIKPTQDLGCGVFRITYRVYSFSATRSFSHRNELQSLSPDSLLNARSDSRFDASFTDYIKGTDNLKKSGSITRGVAFGNNRDVSFTSGLNLQLSGELSEGVNILAVVSDKNNPVQPEGNTRNFQEFDRIFIKVYGKKAALTAGDIEIIGESGEFFRVRRSARGALADITSVKKSGNRLHIVAGGAAARGKFARQTIDGVEGNQGPYRLKGNEAEIYIIMVSGSERVFLDGCQLTRGSDQDYTISYSTAELFFTAKSPITKDSRIVVEFEYADQNYSRFLTSAQANYQGKSWETYVNVFSESDLKNQPLGNDLTSYRKTLMANAGDNINDALVSSVDTVAFNPDELLYASKDSIVNGLNYLTYQYSTDPTKAVYRLRFSLIGEGKGNYAISPIIANGRVYQWLAPVNGVPQGSYEPVIQLTAPIKKQFATAGLLINKGRTRYGVETAGSLNDKNTFSQKDSNDDVGTAFSAFIERKPTADTSALSDFTWRSKFRHLSSGFNPIDRFYPVEYERNWNLTSTLIGKPLEENNLLGEIQYKRGHHFASLYKAEYLDRGRFFKGWNANGDISLIKKWGFIKITASYLKTQDTSATTNFLRSHLAIEKNLGKLAVGAVYSSETNHWLSKAADTLLATSKGFQQIEGYLRSNGKVKVPFTLTYRNRLDYSPRKSSLTKFSEAKEVSSSLERTGKKGDFIRLLASLRSLQYADNPTGVKEETMLGRLEGGTTLLRKAIGLNGSMDMGSGLIPSQDYTFIKVAAGQGQYTWNDYNGNGTKEVNEFEIAAYADQAEFMKVNLPTSKYIKAYTSGFTAAARITPSMAWRDTSGFRSVVSCFSVNGSAQADEKQAAFSAIPEFFPSLNAENTIAHKGSWRYGGGFISRNKRYFADIYRQASATKQLLLGGSETREVATSTLSLRYRPTAALLSTWQGEQSNSTANSDLFPSKNNELIGLKSLTKAELSVDLRYSFVLLWEYAEKKNTMGIEKSFTHKFGAEAMASVAGKMKVETTFSWLRIDAFAPLNSPVSYELLNGLKPGKNAIWTLILSRKLPAGIEINLGYNGRYIADGKIIHSGSMEVRASF